MGVRVRYLHSEVDTLQRIELIRDLRLGEYDVLVGINLLREGLRHPRGIARGDPRRRQGGLLRSERSLIQMIGRAARNVNGQVAMYADAVTDSMTRDLGDESTSGTPAGLQRRARDPSQDDRQGRDRHPRELRGTDGASPLPTGGKRKQRPGEKACGAVRRRPTAPDLALIGLLEEEMHRASTDLRFEEAARLRDEIKDLERERRSAGG